MLTVAALHVHPLKSGRPLRLDRMTIDRLGPVLDRRWMVVDTAGQLVTQREIAGLCHIAALPTDRGLRLEGPGMSPIEVPFPGPTSPRLTVTVWDDSVVAADAGWPAHSWLERALGATVRLVHFPDTTDRRTDPDYDPIGGSVSFADGFPILIVSEASLEDLNRRLEVPLPMNRFRPNIVVRGATPFAEDGWKRIRISGIDFDVVKPCARCVMTTTDQETGERAVEPLKTLATFRKQPRGVMFGMNVVHRGTGSIASGDEVTVIA